MLEPRPKVLVADDDDDLRQLIHESLPKHKYEVYQASDGPETWEVVRNLRPDIVILDILMPGLDGLDICRNMRANQQTRHIPVIMLTAKVQLKDKLKGIECGADDYITKPFDPMELQARIAIHLRRYFRESDMSPVTQLPGSKAIEGALASRIEEGAKFAVCYVDLDDFKAFNDYYGFHAGSEVIRMTGELLAEAVREYGAEGDFLGHIGGDDFIILTSVDTAERLCSAIIEKFDDRIRSYYRPEDVEQGFIVSTDRRGHTMTFPIMTVSISVVHNENRNLTDPDQIGRIAAELKKYAKDLEGSVCVVDRRTT
jgi:diguanylate cyclase (GGDEF)-like protein